MEDFQAFDDAALKHFRFNPIYNNDLNDMIETLVGDESNQFAGKKLIASGSESLSFTDIDSMIKQTYSTKKSHQQPNQTLQKIISNWQLFFHGNTHVTNMLFFLNFVQSRNPQFSGFENASQLLGVKTKSFREYYSEKAEKFDDRIQKDIDILKEDPVDLRFPKIQNYWNLSLD
jgi:hypothetical protein